MQMRCLKLKNGAKLDHSEAHTNVKISRTNFKPKPSKLIYSLHLTRKFTIAQWFSYRKEKRICSIKQTNKL